MNERSILWPKLSVRAIEIGMGEAAVGTLRGAGAR